jgi:hypothetical protein
MGKTVKHLDTIRPAQSDTVAIFVHGILSNAESCWKHSNGAYWPDLLAQELDINEIGIYTFTYRADIFSGSYSLSDAVDSLKENLVLENLLNKKQLIFVCHSMGGIVVRKFVVDRQTSLIDQGKWIGLFLIATPSIGSKFANFITTLAKLVGIRNAQLEALRFTQNNGWLNDLDRNFINLIASKRLTLYGKELIEDNSIVLKKWLRRKQIVSPSSSAKYFGEPYKVPYSDHSTISKPESRDAVQHSLLCDFIAKNFGSAGADESQAVTEKPTHKIHCDSESDPEPTDEEKQVQVEAICKLVLKELASLLDNEQLLKKELSERLDGAEDVVLTLCEAAKKDLGNALDKLIAATRKTLKNVQSDRTPDSSIMYTNAKKAMNWLLLLSVDPGWLWRHRDVLIDGVTAQPLVTSAESEFGADLGFSALQQRPPSRHQMTGLFKVHLPDTLNIDGLLDPGPGELAQLDEIKKALWRIVFPAPTKRRPEEASSYQPPPTFGRGKKSRHNHELNVGIVSLRNSEGGDHYCITSVAIDQSDFSRGLIKSVQEDLPGLSVVVFGIEGGRSVLVVLEHAIQTRLRNMHGLMQAEDER